MTKKNDAKTSRKSKTPAAAAKRKAQAAEKSTVKEPIEVLEEQASKAAAAAEALPKAEVTEAAQEVPAAAEPVEAAQEAPAAEEPVEAAEEALAAEEPVEAVQEAPAAAEPVEAAQEAPAPEEAYMSPRRSVAFIGSECYPFVKTGGLGDVMYALPKALVKQNCDVKVILPRYKCIPWEYQEKMVYRVS